MASAASRNKKIASKIGAGNSPQKAVGSLGSTAIDSIKYKPDDEDLIIKFVNGGNYEYYDVPEEVADDFEEAGSLGKFFNNNIKPSYRYNRR
jgi:hypothetical protein